MAVPRTDYEAVAASQTKQIMGGVGRLGDMLERLLITVATAATSTVAVCDGNGDDIAVVAANTPVGCYSVNIGAACRNATTPGWKVTTGAGVSVVAIGRFGS
jgi:hypothetical protein